MFDTQRIYDIVVPTGSDPSGRKTCSVRFPTDAEWCERARKTVIIRRQLNAGAVVSETPDDERVDAELFGKIRADGGQPEMDSAEASYVIGKLESCQVTDCTREGITFRVSMKVPGGAVIHALKMPTKREEMTYARASTRPVQMRHHVELRVYLEPGGDLWDKCLVSTEGYAEGSAVPIVHKSTAVAEMLRMIGADAEEPDPEA